MEGKQQMKEGQVRQQLVDLEKVIGSLDGEILNLSNLLHLVIREELVEEDSGKTPLEVLVPLANEIRGYVEHIGNIVRYLIELGKRLEL